MEKGKISLLFIVISKANETIKKEKSLRTKVRSTLSDHEEMIRMHQMGIGQKEIAEKLGVSISTVSRHINGVIKPLKSISIGSRQMVVKKELIGNMRKIKQKIYETKPAVKPDTRKVKVAEGTWVHADVNEPEEMVIARWQKKLKLNLSKLK